MMKKIISTLLVAAMLTLAGCSSLPQPTIEELMSEVNAEHQVVEGFEGDLSPYLREPAESIEFDRLTLFPEAKAEYQPEKLLTFEQAKEDIDFVFHVFHDTYGLYDYFGGDEAFSQAKQSALQQCESAETLTCEFLAQSLLQNLSFVKDGHFSIAQQSAAPRICPFFYREVAFMKTEEGYQSEDGKQVESVEGYEDLDQLFRRSISPQGELVYYPVVLKEVEDVELHDEEGIPVLYAKWVASQDFANSALEMQEEANMVNLTGNGGGYMPIASEWWENYVGETVPTNHFSIYTQQNMGTKGFVGMEDEMGVQVMDGWTLVNTHPDSFIENENLLVILTSKKTASAAEMFVDLSHNVENTLVIGENTAGCLTGNAASPFKLMYSRIEVSYGNMVTIFPEGDFAEGYGYEPDLWCPAVWAQEAAVHFLNKQL